MHHTRTLDGQSKTFEFATGSHRTDPSCPSFAALLRITLMKLYPILSDFAVVPSFTNSVPPSC